MSVPPVVPARRIEVAANVAGVSVPLADAGRCGVER